MMPPSGSVAKASMAGSISALVRTPILTVFTLYRAAAASIAVSINSGRKAGWKMSATLANGGMASLSSSSHLPPIEANRSVTPVVLPSGRAIFVRRAICDGIAGIDKNDRNIACLLLYRLRCHAGTHDNHVRPQVG